MNISKSNVKIMSYDELYTFLQKDEDSGIRIYYDDGKYVNLVTKNEVLENMPDVTYLDKHRVFYYLHGQCIQLAVYEDIIGGAYTITFNNDPMVENNGNVNVSDEFTTLQNIDVSKVRANIDYSINNTNLTCNEYVEQNEISTKIKIVTTTYVSEELSFLNGDFTYTDVIVDTGQLESITTTYTVEELTFDETTIDGYTLTDTERFNTSIILTSEEITYS